MGIILKLNRLIRILKWILTGSWMIVIFMFSNQPAVISDENSQFIIVLFKKLGINLDSMIGTLANFMVRKAAHFTEYFILYFLIYIAIREYMSIKKALIISLLIVFLYASTDEIHQLFIPGREGRFRDVMIDTSGGFLCLIINYFVTFKKSSARRIKS